MIVTEKIEQFWRDATAEDATNGRHLLARFRDYPNRGWYDNRTLSGWRRTAGEPSLIFYDESGVPWSQCQVYDPVTKDPTAAQKLAEQTLKAVWVANESTAEIEAFKDPSYHTGDLVKVIGPISRPHTHWDHAMDRHIGKVCKVASARRHPKGNVFYVLDGILTWSFLEDFLESADTSKTSTSSVAAQPANLPALKVGDVVMLPNGQTIQITKSGFELF